MRDAVAGGGEPGREAGRHGGHISKEEGRMKNDEMLLRQFRAKRYFFIHPSAFILPKAAQDAAVLVLVY